MGKEKKVAFITGATGELGSVVAQKFTDLGYEVYGSVRPGKLAAAGETAINLIEVDLMSEEDCQNLPQALGHASIDAMVLSAGGFAMGDLAKTDEKALDHLIALNFKTAYNVIRQLHPLLSDDGRIVLISGRPAFEASAGQHMVAYALTKKMIVHLAEILNAMGVVCSVVVPGVLNTEANRNAMPDADANKWVSLDNVASTISFLCSNEGSEVRDTVVKLYGES